MTVPHSKPLLSQDEIDALLHGVDDGDVETEAEVSDEEVRMIQNRLNNRPRKLLDYKTLNEVFLTIFNPKCCTY